MVDYVINDVGEYVVTGAAGNGTTDDTAVIQRTIDAATAAGGGVVRLLNKKYLIGTSLDLTIKPNVALVGNYGELGYVLGNDWSGLLYQLIVDPAHSVVLQRNSVLEGFVITRKGLAKPTSVRTAIDIVRAFAGTAVKIGDGTSGQSTTNGADATVRRLLVLGFNWGIYVDRAARSRIQDVLGDCTNGLYIGHSADVATTERVSWTLLVTVNNPAFTDTQYAVNAAVDNGNGTSTLTFTTNHQLQAGDVVTPFNIGGVPNLNQRATVTAATSNAVTVNLPFAGGAYTRGGMVDPRIKARFGVAFQLYDADDPKFVECFEYGHDTGWLIGDMCNFGEFISCGYDGSLVSEQGTVGIHFSQLTTRNKWVGGFFNGKAKAIVHDVYDPREQISRVDTNTIIGALVPSGTVKRSVDLIRGSLTVIGCDLVATMYINDTADALTILGCDTKQMTLAGSPAAIRKATVTGGRTNVPGLARMSGGTVELGIANGTSLAINSSGQVIHHSVLGPFADNYAAYLGGVPHKGLYFDGGAMMRMQTSFV